MACIARSNTLRPSHPDDYLVIRNLDLMSQLTQPSLTAHREYMFSLFMLRYRILDVALWIWHDDLPIPNEVMRTRLPDTRSIVSTYNILYAN